MATDRQIKFLCWKGWRQTDAARLTKRQASGVIGKIKEREREAQAS